MAAKKKRKPCPTCMRLRWLVLYFVCVLLILLLFADGYLKNVS